MPPPWVTYSPLLPLALLLFTGLYMFALPYATKWRSGRRGACTAPVNKQPKEGRQHEDEPVEESRISI